MPRRRPAAEPVIPSTALVASATRYAGKAPRIFWQRQNWQAEAYRHYGICGEARFAASFFGHAVSRAKLGVADVSESSPEKLDSGPAYDALSSLFNGDDGQTQMLNALGLHLTIAGEAYLVGRHVENMDVWEIVSVMEMMVTGDKWKINYGGEKGTVELTESDVVIRIWTPSPSKRMEPDSPFKSLLPILGEIEWLTRHVFAQVSSRLAGAGILLMPQGMTFPPAPHNPGGQATETTDEASAFMATLADAMLTPIEEPGSPSALVPIVVTAPDDSIDKPRLLTFWSELDSAAMELRNEAIRRFALGMDLPPEQVMGMSSNGGTGGGTSNGVSHWGAWQIEEATIKMHIEPMLDVIVNALTVGYLWPLLPDGTTAAVVYDSSLLRLRPDRSQEAFELYDRGLISSETLLRENGFDEDDRMDPEEFRTWLLVKIASGSSTPEQVGAALVALGVDLGLVYDDPNAETVQNGPPPSLEDHPSNDLPNAAALLAASEGLVFRALERAGNRLRQSAAKPPGVPSYETHCYVRANGSGPSLLADAWSCAPQVLDGIADPAKVVVVLDGYCTSLLAEQAPHSRDRLAEWLRLVEP